jgi:membrane protein CcdC involved in cytochrome C biogenesis
MMDPFRCIRLFEKQAEHKWFTNRTIYGSFLAGGGTVMEHIFPFDLHLLLPFIVLIFAIMVIVIRIRATNKPTHAKKIILPPLGMSTGFLMFLYPPTHIPLTWGLTAFTTGAVFLSIPLIQTSKLQVVDQQIYLKRSRAFIFILIILLVIRLSLHTYMAQQITLFQTAALFFVLAFGMLLPWRLVMYYQYQRLQKQLSQKRIAQSP